MAESISMLATFACSLFAGAATYIALVEHRPGWHVGPRWPHGSEQLQASHGHAVSLALGDSGWPCSVATRKRDAWLVGALLIVSVIPFTLVVIMPTNNKLLEPGRDNSSKETHRLLETWGRLHVKRAQPGGDSRLSQALGSIGNRSQLVTRWPTYLPHIIIAGCLVVAALQSLLARRVNRLGGRA